jgi:hypothetical protein
MKHRFIAPVAAFFFGSLAGLQAQTTVNAWTFDNVAVGVNSSPNPSTGLGTASALGMNNSFNNTNSVSNPDIQSLAGSSSGGPNTWRVRGFSNISGQRGNGWSTAAALGTQGAQFAGSTFGYYRIKVSFDVYATPDAEANLQVQYSTDGSNWNNATIASVGSGGVIQNNNVSSATTNATVVGSYVTLAGGWNEQVTVNLTGISGVDNDATFAIRMVNASSGTNCVDTTGAVYNNASGNWSFDNVVIQGSPIDTIAAWTFESEPNDGTIITNPVPDIGGALVGQASSLGFNNNYTYTGIGTGSFDASDVINTGGSSSGAGGPNAWRLRGAYTGTGVAGPGWNSAAPIGTQGAEYDVNTSGYSNIVCSFDIFFTSQGEAKICVLYTTDGWTHTNVANNLFYGSKPSYILTNSTSANTVVGTYFYQTGGSFFYNNLVIDFSGNTAVDNNPLFGIRIVNAATGIDNVNSSGGAYNNSSGNSRHDNVTVGGTAGMLPPTIAFAANATVDTPFTNTFVDNPLWRSKISVVYVNGLVLTNTAYNTNIAGQIVFTPSQSALLQTKGIKNIAISAQGFGTARVTQPLAAGVATKLVISTQVAGPTASSGTLTANPVLLVSDQYNNGATNPYANVTATASVGGAGAWTLGGDKIQPAVDGMITFSNLTATLNDVTPVTNAFIAFTVAGYPPETTTNSASFNIATLPVAFTPGNLAVLQVDTLSDNTTFSIVEVNPSGAGQTVPVNIAPISASGPNGMRQSKSGTTGRLSLSDDGTLLAFAAFVDNSSATPDETMNLNRAAASFNYSFGLTLAVTYTSTSLGGSQARAACVLGDGQTYIVDDKGGLYQGTLGDATIDQPNLNPYNNVVVRTFGGTPWVETQKAVAGQAIPVVYALGLDPVTGLWDVTLPNNLTTDPIASDFYMISTNGGSTYDVLYINDQVSGTQGVIKKYSLVGGSWMAGGSFTNKTGVDGLFATTNKNGGVYLFYTTGGGGTGTNSIVRVTDGNGWGKNISITASNVIYTTSASTSIKGLTFAPQVTPNTAPLVPGPVLIPQNGATVAAPFTVTCSPDDPVWRAGITTITVNGSLLPGSAYDATQAGKIVFTPAQSALLQSSGIKNILVTATGYGPGLIVQTLGPGPATQLAVTTQPVAPAGNGGPLATEPVVKVQDAYGNTITSSAASIAAAAVQGTWVLGGTTTKLAVSGVATFNDLTAFSINPVNGATISFTSSGLTPAVSMPFNIPTVAILEGAAISGGAFGFSFSNITGQSYSVLATNNLRAPLSTWPVIGNPVESPSGSGHYQFTDPNPATNSRLFYILRQP